MPIGKERRYWYRAGCFAVDIAANKLPYMESLYGQLKDEVDNLQRIRQYLSNDIQALKNKFQY